MYLKKTVTLCILSSLAMLTACGGGGSSDDKYQSSPASLSNTELAQVAAAIQAAKTTFEAVSYDGEYTISNAISERDVNKDISCRSGSYRVTPNSNTPYGFDGRVQNKNCLTSTSKWDGAIEIECLDAKCDKSITTSTGAVWGDLNRKVDLKINGDVYSDSKEVGFKGVAAINIAGVETRFDFAADGLVNKYIADNLQDGFGRLTIDNNNNRCIAGTYAYQVKSYLVEAKDSARLVKGEIAVLDAKDREVGRVQFNDDGGVSTIDRSGKKENFSITQFERYCGLSEAYRFSS